MARSAENAVMLIGPNGRGTLIDRHTAERIDMPCPAPRADLHSGRRFSFDRRERRRTPDILVRGRILNVAV